MPIPKAGTRRAAYLSGEIPTDVSDLDEILGLTSIEYEHHRPFLKNSLAGAQDPVLVIPHQVSILPPALSRTR